jgi:maltose alpha-D-glucosyltransferase/alpha-amylase
MGNWQILETGHKEILGMQYTWKGRSLYIWHNFKPKAEELKVPGTGCRFLTDLINNIISEADEAGAHTIILEAYGYRWFRDDKELAGMK